MPGAITKSLDQAGEVGGSRRDHLIQHNSLVPDLETVRQVLSIDALMVWTTGANSTANPLARGSTDTQIGSGGFTFSIAGVPERKAGVAAGTAIGAQTVPADTWALYALDIATGGAITVTAAAANATTGYATELLAIAALPARVTAKARMGYITVKTKAATAWIAATDALAGGASGNPASVTNYYPQAGLLAPTGNNVTNGWAGGANGVLIATVLSRGSTDTNLASTAFTYNANGITNIAKGAVATGTALGALGTIPASKWGIIVAYIDAAGAITFQSHPVNYSTGFPDETTAINALGVITVPANKCQMGYITVKASASTWVAGTDALAGGASGNPATTTNYYPNAGITLASGLTASQIGNVMGTAITV